MRAIISIGSNLGDARSNLLTAVHHLTCLSVTPLESSSIWRTDPVGFDRDVPEFYNVVVIIESDLKAEMLLENLQKIELKMGRSRNTEERYDSRIIDLDIIDFGGQKLSSSRLTLPHPRAHLRHFVLLPLREIAPDFRFRCLSESLEELIEKAPPERASQFSRLIL